MKLKEEKFTIEISKPTKDFDSHLSIPLNERIIFSGGFGTGKTYFLNEYFKNHEKYEVIHLYPVNYSIASNEDIMELMKYDIGFELMKKDLNFKRISFSKLFTVQFFIQNKFNNLFNSFLEHVAKAGKSLFSLGEKMIDLKKQVDELEKEFIEFHQKSQVDQEKQIKDFLEEFKKEAGSLYEEDNMTILIRELIGLLKENKETILVIDDLDRIDPEHIFRLLNVFSAHFDLNSRGNKFGFDKVILVCDVENIRNIFHAKYGSDVDFIGYIDKFYSKEIFKFDNLQVVADSILKLLATIQMEEKQAMLLKLKDPSARLTNEIHYILQGMIQTNAINLRSLIKLYQSQYSFNVFEFTYEERRKYNTEIGIILIFNFLKFVLGNEIALTMALYKCAQLTKIDYYDRYDHSNKEKIGNLIVILDIEKHLLNPDNIPKAYSHPHYGLEVGYTLERDNSTRGGVWVAVSDVNNSANIKYFKLLEETYHKLHSLHMLK